LPDDIVVHGAELMADPRLNFGVEGALLTRLAGLRLCIFHDLFHASPRVKSLKPRQLFLDFEVFAASL
jgi:hypothetical protein